MCQKITCIAIRMKFNKESWKRNLSQLVFQLLAYGTSYSILYDLVAEFVFQLVRKKKHA